MVIAISVLCFVCVAVIGFMFYLTVRQHDAERAEWSAERQKLLDRIQASNFNEYKSNERADKPRPAVIKSSDPLSKEPYL